jgi:hypothetical protein
MFVEDSASFGQIAKAIGVARQVVHRHAHREGWPAQRTARTEGGTPPVPVAERTPPGRRPVEEIVLAFIDRFAESLRAGRVRTDSVGDLDKAVRLLAFARGEADSRKETRTTLSLEVLQKRHLETRQIIETIGEEVTGVIHGGSEAYAVAEGDPTAPPLRLTLPPPRQGWEAARLRALAADE